jgi:hypothetical protein
MDRVRGNLRRAAFTLFLAAFTSIALAQDNPETPLRDAPPPLSAGEQVQVIEKAREVALQYTVNLPNFICTVTHAPEGIPKDWPAIDVPAELDYGFAEIGGQQFLLPLRAEMRVLLRNGE